ncbi:hypothetical protein GQF03_15215 [Sneathiella chungangensis]|uniref:Divergent polysaccharide deacetylase family protein n=1 Tax=Sneathiella chungangensis TaxID=1418234 RepID=A0A845MJ43_9PROT|nr:divergent polysaccharide deacetylase family protein [Sneathiella chungangensis]MZR23685.1 hypothetical protein [Sneathiella chungangensis]
MGTLNKDRLEKPTPDNRVSVLFILSLALVLAIIGVSSWSYLGSQAERSPVHVTASTAILAPEEIPPANNEGVQDVVKEPDAPPPIQATPPLVSPPPVSATADDTTELESGAVSGEAPAKEAAASVTLQPPTTEPMATQESPSVPELPESDAASDREESRELMNEELPDSSETDLKILEMPADDLKEQPVADPPPQEAEPKPAPEEESTVIAPALEPVPDVATDAASEVSDSIAAAPVDATPASETAEQSGETAVEPVEDATAAPADTSTGAPVLEIGPAPQPMPEMPAETQPEINADAENSQGIDPTPPWKEFAAAFTAQENLPRIAIVISEAGMNSEKTRMAINNLPAAITLGFNPYGDNLQLLVDEARQAGHEVLLQVPMEPFGYPAIDPGPQALRTDLTDMENLARLEWTLNRITGYAGLTNQMGSKFTATAEALRPAFDLIREKGLLYLDSRTASNSVAAAIAAELEIPVAINNRFLDHKADGDVIDARLQELEEIARRTGSAIGIAYPHEETFRHLADWAKTLEEKGLALAPVSALVNRQEIR